MRDKEPYDEKRALELLAQGSEYAFAQIFDHYRSPIYRSALRFLKSQEQSEEIVQEVFLKVWRKREVLGNVNSFKSYIFAIGRNLIFDTLKKLAEEKTASLEYAASLGPENSTERILLEQQYEELLTKAVDQLPPQQKLVFRLAKIDGLSHDAIARQLNLSRLTVKRHMATALQTIRLQLQHHIIPVTIVAIIAEVFGNGS